MSRSRDLATLDREYINADNEFQRIQQELNSLTRGMGISGVPTSERGRYRTLLANQMAINDRRAALGIQIAQLSPTHAHAWQLASRDHNPTYARAYDLLEGLGMPIPEIGRRLPSETIPGANPPPPAAAVPVPVPPPVARQAEADRRAAEIATQATAAAQAAAARRERERTEADRALAAERTINYEREMMALRTPEGRAAAARQLAEGERSREATPPTVLPARPPFRTESAHLNRNAPANANMSFEGQPYWQANVIKEIIDQAAHNFNTSYEPYGGIRYAPFSESELNAADLIQHMAGNPEEAAAHRERQTGLREARDASVLENAVNKYLEPGAEGLTAQEIHELQNPYNEQVIDRYLQKSDRHFFEDIAPKLNRLFSSRGAFHSGARQTALQKAIERHHEEQDNHVSGLLYKGYEHAAGLAEHGKGRKLQGAGLAGKVGEGDVERKIAATQGLQDLSTAYHGNERLNIDALQQLGGRFRAYQQRGLDTQYEDWRHRKEHPFRQVRELSEIVNRQPPTGHVHYGTPQAHVQDVPVSPFTVAGAGLGQLIGNQLLNKKNAASGGRISMQSGGDVSDIPERIELMNALRQRSQELESDRQQPFWGWFTNMMTGIGSNVAKAPNKDIGTAAAMSLPYAQSGYEDVIARNQANRQQSLELKDLIARSQIMQQEREERRQMMHDQFRLKELLTTAKLKKLNSEIGLLNKAALPTSQNLEEDPAIAHEREVEEEMLRDIKALNKKTGSWTKPGSWAAQAAADKHAWGHNIARRMYDEEALAALDTLAKNRNELSTAKSANFPGSKNQFIEQQISGSIPSADISGKAAQKLLEKSIIKKGGNPFKDLSKEKFRSEVEAALVRVRKKKKGEK